MLAALAISMVIFWMLATAAQYTFGGLIHLLLAGAMTMLLVQYMVRRRA